jgi:hypothetical protein
MIDDAKIRNIKINSDEANNGAQGIKKIENKL